MSREEARSQTSFHARRAFEGDRESLEWLVSHLAALVEAQVRFRLGAAARDGADVHDLAAEVWMVTLQRVRELEPRDGRHAPVLVKFLGTTATHVCNAHLRRRARAALQGSPPEEDGAAVLDAIADPVPGTVTRACDNEVRERIEACLGRLEESKRNLLALRLLEHRPNVEVARLLGLRPNTVAVQYRRALGSLRECLPRSLFENVWSLRSVGPAADRTA